MGLGLTPEALWRLTPREFEALSDRYLSYHRHQDEQWAMSASMFYNAHRGKDSRELKATDFMPGAKVDPDAIAREHRDRMKELEVTMMLARPVRVEDVPDWAKARAN